MRNPTGALRRTQNEWGRKARKEEARSFRRQGREDAIEDQVEDDDDA